MTWTRAIGVLVGAVVGYAFHRGIGCSSGACALVSSAPVASFYGAVLGLVASR